MTRGGATVHRDVTVFRNADDPVRPSGEGPGSHISASINDYGKIDGVTVSESMPEGSSLLTSASYTTTETEWKRARDYDGKVYWYSRTVKYLHDILIGASAVDSYQHLEGGIVGSRIESVHGHTAAHKITIQDPGKWDPVKN